jgi:hypothetical protein
MCRNSRTFITAKSLKIETGQDEDALQPSTTHPCPRADNNDSNGLIHQRRSHDTNMEDVHSLSSFTGGNIQ